MAERRENQPKKLTNVSLSQKFFWKFSHLYKKQIASLFQSEIMI